MVADDALLACAWVSLANVVLLEETDRRDGDDEHDGGGSGREPLPVRLGVGGSEVAADSRDPSDGGNESKQCRCERWR